MQVTKESRHFRSTYKLGNYDVAINCFPCVVEVGTWEVFFEIFYQIKILAKIIKYQNALSLLFQSSKLTTFVLLFFLPHYFRSFKIIRCLYCDNILYNKIRGRQVSDLCLLYSAASVTEK